MLGRAGFWSWIAIYLSRCIWLALLLCLGAFTTKASADSLRDGERLYNEGILPNGSLLVARVMGNARLTGRFAACVRCHRPSGYGSSEGNLHTPAIGASVLFNSLEPRRDRLFRQLYQERQGVLARMDAQIPRLRSAYADQYDLARALSHGLDPDGEPLAASMPRYEIASDALKSLTMYLRQLSATPDPGVDQLEMHFATVIGPDVPVEMADAMLSVMLSFIERHNREIKRERDRPEFSANYKALYVPSRRYWRLHVWRLHGTAQEWSAQLSEYYRQKPVFAMLSGLLNGEWQPVDNFCESVSLPCLFPLTQWPAPGNGHFTRYLSTGAPGEADLVLRYLKDSDTRYVTLIRNAQPDNLRLARRIESEIDVIDQSLKINELKIYAGSIEKASDDKDHSTVEQASGDASTNKELVCQTLRAGQTLRGMRRADERAVILLMSAEQSQLAVRCLHAMEYSGTIMLIGSQIADGRGHPEFSVDRPVLLSWQTAVPGAEPRRLYRLRRWLQARRIAHPEFEHIQLNTYLALDATRHALTHLIDRYSREYYLETVEHDLENALNPGTFMRLSLGPEQRFAARGGQIMELAPDGTLQRTLQ